MNVVEWLQDKDPKAELNFFKVKYDDQSVLLWRDDFVRILKEADFSYGETFKFKGKEMEVISRASFDVKRQTYTVKYDSIFGYYVGVTSIDTFDFNGKNPSDLITNDIRLVDAIIKMLNDDFHILNEVRNKNE